MTGVVASLSIDLLAKVVAAAAGPAASPSAVAKVNESRSVGAGNSAVGKADVMYSATTTIAASGTLNLDLTGSLVDPLGRTVAEAEVIGIWIKAHADNVNQVVVGGAASNGFIGPFGDQTDKLKINPGQFALLWDDNGWPVVGGTGDILLIANSSSGTAVTFDIVVIGRTIAG